VTGPGKWFKDSDTWFPLVVDVPHEMPPSSLHPPSSYKRLNSFKECPLTEGTQHMSFDCDLSIGDFKGASVVLSHFSNIFILAYSIYMELNSYTH